MLCLGKAEEQESNVCKIGPAGGTGMMLVSSIAAVLRLWDVRKRSDVEGDCDGMQLSVESIRVTMETIPADNVVSNLLDPCVDNWGSGRCSCAVQGPDGLLCA